MAGYSSTPLVKKLGIREGERVAFLHAPVSFEQVLGSLPPKVTIERGTKGPLDLVVLFVTTKAVLAKDFARMSARLYPNGMLWVAWPKKASGVATDLCFNVVQSLGLGSGMVDTKICAIDDVWSGLKFVYRLKDRKSEKMLAKG